VIQSDGELIDLIHRGQGVLNILPLGGVRDEMDARIRELRPSDESFLGSGLGDQVASKRVV
jgi:hypothetical protein